MNEFWSVFIPHIPAFLAAAFGGFFGALAAFLFQKWRDARYQRNRQYSALIRVQSAMIAQINTLANIQQQFLNPFRNQEDRFLKLPPFFQATSNLNIDFDGIAFLLEDDDARIVHEVYIADRRYHTSLTAVQLRNIRLERFYDDPTVKLEEFDWDSGRSKISTTDPRKLKLIKSLTDDMYETIDEAIELNEKAYKELNKAIKKLYPKRRTLHYELSSIDTKIRPND